MKVAFPPAPEPSEAAAEADVIIVAVPTPVDDAKIPDFRPLIGSSTSVGRHMKRGAVVNLERATHAVTPSNIISVATYDSASTPGHRRFVMRVNGDGVQDVRQRVQAAGITVLD